MVSIFFCLPLRFSFSSCIRLSAAAAANLICNSATSAFAFSTSSSFSATSACTSCCNCACNSFAAFSFSAAAFFSTAAFTSCAAANLICNSAADASTRNDGGMLLGLGFSIRGV